MNNESCVITGSEDSYIYLYDIHSSNIVKKYKTNQKCVNLVYNYLKIQVKPFPNIIPLSFVFSGLEDTSIYIWKNNGILSNKIEKEYVKNLIKQNSVRKQTRHKILILKQKKWMIILIMKETHLRSYTCNNDLLIALGK